MDKGADSNSVLRWVYLKLINNLAQCVHLLTSPTFKLSQQDQRIIDLMKELLKRADERQKELDPATQKQPHPKL
jgi:hypothetical protein